MRDKLKPIDISIASIYLGRFQTAIVAILVLGITVHALVTRRSARDHVTLVIEAPGQCESYEPLARLIAARTGRSVSLVEGDARAELWVLPSMEFLRRRSALDLVPLFGLCEVPGDRALILAAGADARAPGRAAEVLFSSPASVNGCWVQLHALSRREASVPSSADSLRFARGGRQVAWAVGSGAAHYGACRASDLEGFDLDGVTVVFQAPALPERIVAARASDQQYFLGRLGGLGAALDAPSESERDVVELLHARGVGSARPVSPGQLKDLEAVFEFMSGMTALEPAGTGGDAGSP